MRNLLIVLLLFVCINGCTMYKVYYDYTVSAKNKGESLLQDVIITSNKGFWHETGYLNVGAVKTFGGLKTVPPNGIYTIVVEDMNDERYSGVVDLHNEIGKGFKGEIIFLVSDKNSVAYKLE